MHVKFKHRRPLLQLARETDDAMSIAPSERHKFVYQGRSVYEWDQTLSEVNIYIAVPAGVTAKQLYVNIERRHIKLGIHPNPPYLTVSYPHDQARSSASCFL